jgi:hypothetical protein
MGMSQSYGPADEGESIATLHRAIELGCTFLDTAEVYGPLKNEELFGRALKGRRNDVVIATNFGFRIEGGKQVGAERDSRPQTIRKVVGCDDGFSYGRQRWLRWPAGDSFFPRSRRRGDDAGGKRMRSWPSAHGDEDGSVKVTEARRHAARPPSRERRSMLRVRATRPRPQSVSPCRLAS